MVSHPKSIDYTPDVEKWIEKEGRYKWRFKQVRLFKISQKGKRNRNGI